MTVAAAVWGGGGTWRRGSKILSWIKSGPGGHTVGSRPTAGIHRGAGRGHAEAATAAAAATRRFTGCIPAKARDDFKTKDSFIAMVKFFYIDI